MIRHLRSSVLIGGFSVLCQGGRSISTATEGKCLFRMPDGVDDFSLDGERICHGGYCAVAGGTCVEDAPLNLVESSASLDDMKRE